MTLPNYLIQNILEKLINKFRDINYIIEFFQKFTLISHEWNKHVINKVRFTLLINQDRYERYPLEKWVFFTEKYQLKYHGVFYHNIDMLSDKINDKINEIAISHIDKWKDLIPIFKNIEIVNINMNTRGLVPWEEQFQPLENVTFLLSINADGYSDGDLHQPDPQWLESVIVQDYFKSLSLQGISFPEFDFNIPIKSKLQKLELKNIQIDKTSLMNLLKNSPNLVRLSMIQFSPLQPFNSLNNVLECISVHLVNLDHITIVSSKIGVSYQDLHQFLNKVKIREMFLKLDIIEFQQSYKEVKKTFILNRNIQSFVYLPLRQKTSPQIGPFYLLDVWKDLSNIRKLEISHSLNSCVLHLKELTKLQSITITDCDNVKEYENLCKIIQFNTPSLQKFTICSYESQPKIWSDILIKNNYIRVISVKSMKIQSLIDLLNSNHPTLISIDVTFLSIPDENVVIDLIKAIKTNKTIQNLQIIVTSDRVYLKANATYNTVLWYTDILSHNHTLEQLQFLWIYPMQEYESEELNRVYDNLGKAISNNSAIKNLHFPFGDFSNDHFSARTKVLNKYFCLF
ncbi:hypothetical protein DLAC_09703 [Tieghemostelium lacteum]|uniref:Uncharacterized protein n=1 Tax=Tieghemostelium lacteum TaxID=361077 RepID=A0A151Z723_TIELA|nr:hypothetical protein DLAC_09703 [Tieghemostelium lacteum]|eukprot:KYQ89735.1 hypothetical protein DLAC_09703 [Tieghemostelium lacteum]